MTPEVSEQDRETAETVGREAATAEQVELAVWRAELALVRLALGPA